MTISGFIELLKKIKKVHGNLELYVHDSIDDIFLIDGIVISNDKLVVFNNYNYLTRNILKE